MSAAASSQASKRAHDSARLERAARRALAIGGDSRPGVASSRSNTRRASTGRCDSPRALSAFSDPCSCRRAAGSVGGSASLATHVVPLPEAKRSAAWQLAAPARGVAKLEGSSTQDRFATSGRQADTRLERKSLLKSTSDNERSRSHVGEFGDGHHV
jgi:hypothetical protein